MFQTRAEKDLHVIGLLLTSLTILLTSLLHVIGLLLTIPTMAKKDLPASELLRTKVRMAMPQA
jgi:hypothetical protein